MKTEICVVLDRSGSMHELRKEMEGGLNTFVSEQAKLDDDCWFTLVQFDDQYEFVHKSVPIKSVPKLELIPRGRTALLDALGKTISLLDQRVKATVPDKVIVLVITDGYENASREWGREQVKRLVDEHSTWEFAYLGANVDAFTEAGGLGIPTRKASGYSGQSVGAAFSALSHNTVATRLGRKHDGLDYTDAQRQHIADAEAGNVPQRGPEPEKSEADWVAGR